MIQADQVLDCQMKEIVQTLNDAGVPIPPALMSQPDRQSTVYHTRPLTADIADKLYEVGFKDVDECGVYEQTLLMIFGRKRSIFEIFHITTVMMPWLIAKGANICKRGADQYP